MGIGMEVRNELLKSWNYLESRLYGIMVGGIYAVALCLEGFQPASAVEDLIDVE